MSALARPEQTGLTAVVGFRKIIENGGDLQMYMIYQQYTSAIKNAYSGGQDVSQHLENARLCRQWLDSLVIDSDLRDALVEPISVLEEAFQDLVEQG